LSEEQRTSAIGAKQAASHHFQRPLFGWELQRREEA
jgi:hypothetical protein